MRAFSPLHLYYTLFGLTFQGVFNKFLLQNATFLAFLNNFCEFTVLKKGAKKTNLPKTDISLSALYTALKQGEDGDIELPVFDVFAPDLSHRLRHGGAVAELTEFGAAVAFTCEYGGIINGIAVKKEDEECLCSSSFYCRYIG